MIPATPDDLGLVTCPQCGARLRAKQPAKLTVQGGASSSSPSLPRIDPARAAPADVDSVLARIDSTPSPDATIRPGALPKLEKPDSAFEMILAELRGIRKTQQEILDILRSGRDEAPRAESRGADEPTARSAAVRGGSLRVLLIDDDARALQEAKDALAGVASVTTAADGNKAMAAIGAERPDVIVLEIGMGGTMPGRDVVNLIKATMEWVDIPIVLYTRTPVRDDAEARQIHGADAIVTKGPGAARLLAERVKSLAVPA